ncbi:hypothetical protein AX774_g1975 [Zancudomyces culisetae]|uniref:Uncharacterized protein n=1 Tax=Zancudomyces culisetae TaxID=1213189 RepID=A0A1R1PU23_ZANCU|nr:hypothetical protein AX774_g7383 [Zancudomyces culisetae]OMH84496.1 hypothetical protein AX774_g1975 [Zancudomyces culisetae]|eukprot:OMH79212.1 hypothetical protein AX774_g7383 [Zancudomyces culisetae]
MSRSTKSLQAQHLNKTSLVDSPPMATENLSPPSSALSHSLHSATIPHRNNSTKTLINLDAFDTGYPTVVAAIPAVSTAQTTTRLAPHSPPFCA